MERRSSKRIRKRTYKGEAFNKTMFSTEDDVPDIRIGERQDVDEKDEAVAEYITENVREEEKDEVSALLNNVFELHLLTGNVSGIDQLMGSSQELDVNVEDKNKRNEMEGGMPFKRPAYFRRSES